MESLSDKLLEIILEITEEVSKTDTCDAELHISNILRTLKAWGKEECEHEYRGVSNHAELIPFIERHKCPECWKELI